MDFTNDPSANEGTANLLWNIAYLIIAFAVIILIIRLSKRVKKSEVKLIPYIKPLSIIVLVIGATLYFMGNLGSWKKKQFNSCEEMLEAFKEVDYDEIEGKFGKPIETFEHFQGFGCVGDEASYEATWSGVGVNGKNTRIQFRAMTLTGTSHLTPMWKFRAM